MRAAERTPDRPGPGPIPDEAVRSLEIALTRRAGGRVAGDHRGLGLGAGLELDRLRPYEPGDDVRRIDWNATARTHIPHVREDVPDRQLTAWLLLDVSASMHFGTADRRKADVAEGAALLVGRFVARRADRLGVVAFGGERLVVRPPIAGRSGLLGLHAILASGPAPDGPAGRSLVDAIRLVAAARTSPGLVAIVSDLRGPRDWVGPLTDVAARHTVLAIEVVDPREERLVDVGELQLVDPESGRRLRVDTGDRRLRDDFAAAARRDREEVAASFRHLGIRHLRLGTAGSWLADMTAGLATTPAGQGRARAAS
jgi:uncharacterized protein (DUF58 family)